jgi:hypothetical protein
MTAHAPTTNGETLVATGRGRSGRSVWESEGRDESRVIERAWK